MIPTVDAISLISKYLAQSTQKYPEGSLSPREVMITLPITSDPNEFAERVNSAITSVLCNRIDVDLKSVPKKQGFSAVAKITTAEDHNKKLDRLSGDVLQAIHQLEQG